MNSTANSDVLLTVDKLRVHFELQHFNHHGLRDVFISFVSNPFNYIFKNPELFYVIDEVSFELKRGTRLGILGVNGSGKTTFCRCLAGMIVGQQGSVTTKSDVRAIFDTGTGIMPELTGRENAYLLARLFYPKIKDLTPIVNDAIEFSELKSFADVPFRQYSKGMQSRLMLSLVSSQPTDVLLLDEVFDGADVFFQAKIANRMKEFIWQSGATVFVSHSFDQIRQVCNEVMIFDKGKIIFHGEVEKGLAYYMMMCEPNKVMN